MFVETQDKYLESSQLGGGETPGEEGRPEGQLCAWKAIVPGSVLHRSKLGQRYRFRKHLGCLRSALLPTRVASAACVVG